MVKLPFKSILNIGKNKETTVGKDVNKILDSAQNIGQEMMKLIDVVMEYTDGDGRQLSGHFWKLPSKKELPDYYEVIKRPVDIAKISRKIEDDKYEDIAALQNDSKLMCKNAQ